MSTAGRTFAFAAIHPVSAVELRCGGCDPMSAAESGLLRMLGYVHDTQASGGLTGLVQQLENGGLGNAVRSWISTGKNMPVTAEQIQSALGSERLAQIAAKLGVSPDVVSQRVAEIFPHLIDHLTPTGHLPPELPVPPVVGVPKPPV